MEESIQIQFDEIFNFLKARKMKEDDLRHIKAAFELATDAHKNQKRKSGEPYITHPLAVARILAIEMRLGAASIMAGFLHDVVEDSSYTIADIKLRFGDDVAFLVNVVTKQKKESYTHSKQIDNFKQMLNSINYDIRALLVKLADRLHNMRTLESMRPDKQMKIAGETDYFYAPLANRLGLHEVKAELANLSLKFRSPLEYAELETYLEADFKESTAQREDFMKQMEDRLKIHQLQARIVPLRRSVYSIWRSMKKEEVDASQVNKYFFQLIFKEETQVSEKDRALQLYSALTDIFKEKPKSMRNYIDLPKENGYQSLHFKLMNTYGEWEEIHVLSERMWENTLFGCVIERGVNIGHWVQSFKDILKDIIYRGQDSRFMEEVVSTFYHDDITVFTPVGDVLILPQKATAMDFAYEIHSKIGNHAKYARINGKLASIKTVLNRGDRVAIGTAKEVTPQHEWIDHAITYKAKRNIQSYLRRHHEEELYNRNLIRCPLCNPLPGEEVIGFKKEKGIVQVHKKNCKDAIRLATQFGDSIVNVVLPEDEHKRYLVKISILAIDSVHLLRKMVDALTENFGLLIRSIHASAKDYIVRSEVEFYVSSYQELNDTIHYLKQIPEIEDVKRIEKNFTMD